MSVSNIKKFDEIVGKTFALLYESFPIPREIAIGEVLQFDNQNTDHMTTQPGYEERLFTSSLNWLSQSGYIIFSEQQIMLFFDVTLTAKGLEVLKKVPDSLSDSLGDKLIQAVKTGAVNKLSECVNKAISAGLQFGLSKIGDHSVF